MGSAAVLGEWLEER
jgi:hypothetical protein